MEQEVTRVMGNMPFVCLPVDDDPDPQRARGIIERGAISLLSEYGKPQCDAPSGGWLGWHCTRQKVRKSGLWNNTHVGEPYDPEFIEVMENYVRTSV